MTPLKALKQTVTVLEGLACKYCLAGGHAASLYRIHERLTRDVDFALVAHPVSESRRLAQQTIERLGLKPVAAFIPSDPKGRRRNAICFISSQPGPNETKGLIDILLPELPWLAPAVERAQHNRIDLGFAGVPVITPEDLIIAKCYALDNSPDRFQDLDDLKEIFQSLDNFDLDYLRANLAALELSIPRAVRKFVPPGLRRRTGTP